MNDFLTICADVGSVPKGNFGWWSSNGPSGDRPSTLVDYLVSALDDGKPVALGFECPLFLPLHHDEMYLTNGRPGERSRAWSATAGCGALATGLVEVAWVLRETGLRLNSPTQAYLSWDSFVAAGTGLFLWEAFVSGKEKGANHIADAELGARALMNALPNPKAANAVACESEVYSLVGAALLRTGWTTDISVLQQPCLVLRALASG
jgi:hypothetical protein